MRPRPRTVRKAPKTAAMERKRNGPLTLSHYPGAMQMTDTTVKKVSSAHSPVGDEGQVYLASGKRVSMRLWRDEEPTQDKPPSKHEYEVVGYVISGRAELLIEGQTVRLEPGDSWVVPAGAE